MLAHEGRYRVHDDCRDADSQDAGNPLFVHATTVGLVMIIPIGMALIAHPLRAGFVLGALATLDGGYRAPAALRPTPSALCRLDTEGLADRGGRGGSGVPNDLILRFRLITEGVGTHTAKIHAVIVPEGAGIANG